MKKQFKPSTKELFYVPYMPASEEIDINANTALKRKDLFKSKKKKTVKRKQTK